MRPAGGNIAKRLIVTADDFGLSPEINRGIVEAHRRGIVTAASLLANAPATADAIALARDNPGLEVGLHLGLVEGIALSRGASLTDRRSYFKSEVCLHRSWRRFLARYLTGRIDLAELGRELELQVERFRAAFDRIPFANGTQHLQLLPGAWAVVLRLAARHGIGTLRAAPFADRVLAPPAPRAAALALLNALARRAQRTARAAGLAAPDRCYGFSTAGRLSEAALLRLLAALPPGTAELVTHPGFDAPALRRDLPWAYSAFNWPGELAALASPAVRAACRERGIELLRFSDL